MGMELLCGEEYSSLVNDDFRYKQEGNILYTQIVAQLANKP